MTTWKIAKLETLADRDTKIPIHPEVSVEGWPGVFGAAAGEGRSTDWELLQSEQILQYWNSLVRPQSGQRVPGPLQ